MSKRVSDPLGKRALFDPAPHDEAAQLIKPTQQLGESGRGALFTAAERRSGTVVMTCGACGAKSRVSLLELGQRALPFTLWFPWQKHSRLLRCPACEQRTWVNVNWLG